MVAKPNVSTALPVRSSAPPRPPSASTVLCTKTLMALVADAVIALLTTPRPVVFLAPCAPCHSTLTAVVLASDACQLSATTVGV
jgi:hypothetical protein